MDGAGGERERGRDENTVNALEITGLSFFFKNYLRLIFSLLMTQETKVANRRS